MTSIQASASSQEKKTGQIITPPEGPLLIDDYSCPICEIQAINGIFKDLSDACLATGLSRADIVAMADDGAPNGAYQFCWPTLQQLQAIWPYPNASTKRSRSAPSIEAVSVEVLLKSAPGIRAGNKLFYKSITSCRLGWEMTRDTFDCIAQGRKGWKKRLPPMMAGIRVGVRLPRNYVTPKATKDLGAFFSVRNLRNRLVFTPRQSLIFAKPQEVPGFILAHSDWKS